MLFGTLFTGEIAKSALVAYVHYLGIILCFGSLLFERLTLKVGLKLHLYILLALIKQLQFKKNFFNLDLHP